MYYMDQELTGVATYSRGRCFVFTL